MPDLEPQLNASLDADTLGDMVKRMK